jgi:hypothetical protein
MKCSACSATEGEGVARQRMPQYQRRDVHSVVAHAEARHDSQSRCRPNLGFPEGRGDERDAHGIAEQRAEPGGRYVDVEGDRLNVAALREEVPSSARHGGG